MNAYTVISYYDREAAVVFANNPYDAIRFGCRKLDVTELDSVFLSPEFDGYASTKKVPPLALIDNGWVFECDHCGTHVDSDTEGFEIDGDFVFCGLDCKTDLREKTLTERKKMSDVVEACKSKFDGIPIFDLSGAIQYNCENQEEVLCCFFDFPGRKGMHVRWELGSSVAWVSECDIDAWNLMIGRCDRPNRAT